MHLCGNEKVDVDSSQLKVLLDQIAYESIRRLKHAHGVSPEAHVLAPSAITLHRFSGVSNGFAAALHGWRFRIKDTHQAINVIRRS
ncbi:hypothetical protein R1flu_005365 [Riccia fluitans]|uniref:Uncharacterized protein n=1 Tax=Riccia fluitans TaxID=41844 RepID=A0ABD1YSZ4_9MARC